MPDLKLNDAYASRKTRRIWLAHIRAGLAKPRMRVINRTWAAWVSSQDVQSAARGLRAFGATMEAAYRQLMDKLGA